MSDTVYVGIVLLIFVFLAVCLFITERLESRRRDRYLQDIPPPMTKYEEKE